MHKTKLFLGLLIGCLTAKTAFSQEAIMLKPGDVKVKDIAIEVQTTPQITADLVKEKRIDRPREWFEIEVEFEADVRGAKKNAVLNELTFRYYVGFVDQNRKPVVLSGDCTHVNVLLGEKTYSAMYITPSLIGKLTGDYRKASDSSIVASGVEVYYNGVLVGGKSDKGKFWEGKAITQNSILSRDKTPFGMLWIDRYPEIKTR